MNIYLERQRVIRSPTGD